MLALPLLPLELGTVPAGLRRLLSQEGIPHCEQAPGRASGRFLLYDSHAKNRPFVAPGQVEFDVRQLGLAWHEDPWQAIEDEGPVRASWPIDGLSLCEEVARTDHRALRRRLMAELRAAIEGRGGIWLTVSPYPHPYRSAFCFRIDHDDYEPHDFEATIRAFDGNLGATSHYVCASAFEGHEAALARLTGLHVGSHGYWHHTYREAEDNLRNIERAIDALRRAGLDPVGFVAPHGRFNPGLLAALETLGVSHSSEFGLAYDELPFFPRESRVLQIPIHPICLGLFLEAAERGAPGDRRRAQQSVDAACDYFRGIVKMKYQAGEPIFLYDHPSRRLGQYPQLVCAVLEAVASASTLWKTNLAEFARWWRARASVRLVVRDEGDHCVVQAVDLPAGFRVGLQFWRGEHVAPLPLDDRVLRFHPRQLAYQGRRPLGPPGPVRIDQAESLRSSLHRLLDWERETPAEEISTRTWRGWAKRWLRRVKDHPRRPAGPAPHHRLSARSQP